jgi:pimeloyl-ACP methyl ester carboxylesterase
LGETIIQANGVQLCAESFGDPADPALLLIMGAKASMLWWDEDFCRRLVASQRRVIRYDLRDTGRSITCEPGHPNYTLDTLADDAIGVLDAFGIDRAHVVGLSLGGIIAQILALADPGRVLTLTVLMSTPLGLDDPDLPPISAEFMAHHLTGSNLDWSDEAAVLDYLVAGRRLLIGTAHPFDEASARDLATREWARAGNMASLMNFGLLSGGERWLGKLGEVRAPTLVIHGTEDPILPYAHGVALAGAIPGAELRTLAGTGHELHPADWETIIPAILRHTAGP